MNKAVKIEDIPMWLEVGDLVTFHDFRDPECEVEPEDQGAHIWTLLERFRHVNAAGGSETYFLARNFIGDERELWIETSDDVVFTLRRMEARR